MSKRFVIHPDATSVPTDAPESPRVPAEIMRGLVKEAEGVRFARETVRDMGCQVAELVLARQKLDRQEVVLLGNLEAAIARADGLAKTHHAHVHEAAARVGVVMGDGALDLRADGTFAPSGA